MLGVPMPVGARPHILGAGGAARTRALRAMATEQTLVQRGELARDAVDLVPGQTRGCGGSLRRSALRITEQPFESGRQRRRVAPRDDDDATHIGEQVRDVSDIGAHQWRPTGHALQSEQRHPLIVRAHRGHVCRLEQSAHVLPPAEEADAVRESQLGCALLQIRTARAVAPDHQRRGRQSRSRPARMPRGARRGPFEDDGRPRSPRRARRRGSAAAGDNRPKAGRLGARTGSEARRPSRPGTPSRSIIRWRSRSDTATKVSARRPMT